MDLAYKKGIIERYARLSVSGRIDFPHHGYKLVSCFKNNIEKFNVEPGAESRPGGTKIGGKCSATHPSLCLRRGTRALWARTCKYIAK
jgi:hypothetical protein